MQPHLTPPPSQRSASPADTVPLPRPAVSMLPQASPGTSRVQVVAVPDTSHMVLEEEDTFVQGAPGIWTSSVAPALEGLTVPLAWSPPADPLGARRHGLALSEGIAQRLRDCDRLVSNCVTRAVPPYRLVEELDELAQDIIHIGREPFAHATRLGAMFELTVLLDHCLNVTYQVICERPDTSPAACAGTFIERLTVSREHFGDEMEMVDVPLAIFELATQCASALAVTAQRTNIYGRVRRMPHLQMEQATLEVGLHQATQRLLNTFKRIGRVLVSWEGLLERRLTELCAGSPHGQTGALALPPMGHMPPLQPRTQRETLIIGRLVSSMRARLEEALLERARVYQHLLHATRQLADQYNAIVLDARAAVPPHA